MKELIEAFPENIKEAIQIAESSNLKQPKSFMMPFPGKRMRQSELIMPAQPT